MALYETDFSCVKVDPKTKEELLIHDLNDPTALQCLALILGDAVHNMKSALDYAWLETIRCLAPHLVDHKTLFPARKNVKLLKGPLTTSTIDKTCPSLYDFMVDCVAANPVLQSAIWTVHRLDIGDKHKLLTPVLTKANIVGIEGTNEGGEPWDGGGISEPQKPPYVIRFKHGIHITNNGKLIAEIVVQDVDLEYFFPISGTISTYSNAISRVVQLFEKFLEMEGH